MSNKKSFFVLNYQYKINLIKFVAQIHCKINQKNLELYIYIYKMIFISIKKFMKYFLDKFSRVYKNVYISMN